jgi:hypothetical protein
MHEISWSHNKPHTLNELIIEFRRPHFKKLLDRLASLQVKISLGFDLEDIPNLHFETSREEGDPDFFISEKKDLILSQFMSEVLAGSVFGAFPSQWRKHCDPYELVRFQQRKNINEEEHDGSYDQDFEVPEVICHALWEVCKQKKISYLSDCVDGLLSNLDRLRLSVKAREKETAEEDIRKVVESHLRESILTIDDVRRCCDEALARSILKT